MAGSPAAQVVTDTLATLNRVHGGVDGKVLLRADSAFYGYATVDAAAQAGALAYIPSGVFTATAAWLVLAGRASTSPAPLEKRQERAGEARTATLRRKLISVPAGIASSARKLRLHLPAAWPWEAAWTDVPNRIFPSAKT